VTLAIREALRPASGEKVDDCFAGLRRGSLKKILKKRFAEMKGQRERELRSRRTGGPQANLDWTIELKLDKDGGVRPILSI
jgi:hypothetical protein